MRLIFPLLIPLESILQKIYSPQSKTSQPKVSLLSALYNRSILLKWMVVASLLCSSFISPFGFADSKSHIPSNLQEQLTLFNQWFPGEYNNHEQVWLQKGLKEDVVFNHVHHIFYPVPAQKVGEHIYYVEQSMAESKKVYRQRIYRFSVDQKKKAIRLDLFKFKDEKKWRGLHLKAQDAKQLTLDDLKEIKGCEVYWNYNPEKHHFTGEMVKDQCRIVSSWSKKTMIINDDLILDSEAIYIRDVAKDESGKVLFGYPDLPHYRNVKVRYFTGWATVRPLGEKTPLDDGKDYGWNLHKGIQLHNEGQKVTLIGSDGKALGYSIQLARISRPGSKTKLLKLSLINDETEKTKAYVWTDPKANRVGMNIGWAQVGLTLEPQTPHYGFDTPQAQDVVELLYTRLQGSFSSKAQAEKNKAYSHDQLRFCPLKVEGSTAPALLMEYTSADQKPQLTVYQFNKEGKDQVRLEPFTLSKDHALSCSKTKLKLDGKHLQPQKGCALTFNYINNLFVGSTHKTKCKNTQKGAEVERIDLRLVKNTLYYWSRGLKDVKDQQKGTVVWGPEEGAYQFERLNPSK